jgi:hypothetical protein
MSYVVQQPHSNTNPTSMHRVVGWNDWLKYSNGEISYLPAVPFSTYGEAEKERDRLNGEVGDEGSS